MMEGTSWCYFLLPPLGDGNAGDEAPRSCCMHVARAHCWKPDLVWKVHTHVVAAADHSMVHRCNCQLGMRFQSACSCKLARCLCKLLTRERSAELEDCAELVKGGAVRHCLCIGVPLPFVAKDTAVALGFHCLRC